MYECKIAEKLVELRTMWDKYRKQFAYAEGIEYEDIIENIKGLV